MLKSKVVRWTLALATGLLFALLFTISGILHDFELTTFDLRATSLAQAPEEDSPVVLVYLSQASLDWADEFMGWSWPWPREAYAVLIDYLSIGGAKSVAVDVLFTEPSVYGVYDDQYLADSISYAGNTVQALVLNEASGQGLSQDLLARFSNQSLLKEDDTYPQYSSVTLPIEEVKNANSILANVESNPDSDGIFRRVHLFGLVDDKIVPTLPMGAYIAAGNPLESVISEGEIRFGDYVPPRDRNGKLILRYRGSQRSFTTVEAHRVINSFLQLSELEAGISTVEPEIPADFFMDKNVFFGFSAPGLLDLRPVPTDEFYPGVEVHATVFDNIINRSFIVESPILLNIFYTIVLLALAALVVRGGVHSIPFYFVVLLPALIGFLAYSLGLWLPMVEPSISILMTIIVATVLNYASEGKQKRFIKQAFSQYLSKDVIQNLIKDPDALKLGGEKRDLSIFFSDLQGFTTISEGLSPEELTILLNEYLTAMTDIILDSEGTIDKYEGDAIIAFWNAPTGQTDHARRMIQAALDCQEILAKLRPDFKDRIGKELHMRIGMNTGPAVVGNMGSNTRFDYTMLGDAVNLAARLEGVNKFFGTFTMVSESSKNEAENHFQYRELGRVAVVGRAEPVRVYEPYYRKIGSDTAEKIAQFQKGLDLWYLGDLSGAKSIFKELAPNDPPSQNYIKRIELIEKKELDGPDAQWKGVWTMTSK